MLTLIMKRRGSVLFKGQDWRVLKIARELPARDEGGPLDMPCLMHKARQPMGGNRRCKPAYPRATNNTNKTH
jgi:hypothetical protein